MTNPVKIFEGFDCFLRVRKYETPIGTRVEVSKYVDRRKRNVWRVHTTIDGARKLIRAFLRQNRPLQEAARAEQA